MSPERQDDQAFVDRERAENLSRARTVDAGGCAPPVIVVESKSLADLRAVAAEMRERLVNHGKHTSPTLIAWADRIDAECEALAGMVRDAERWRHVRNAGLLSSPTPVVTKGIFDNGKFIGHELLIGERADHECDQAMQESQDE